MNLAMKNDDPAMELAALPPLVLSRVLILADLRPALVAASRVLHETVSAEEGRFTLAWLHYDVEYVYSFFWAWTTMGLMCQDMVTTWTAFAALVQSVVTLHEGERYHCRIRAPMLNGALFRAFLSELRWGGPSADGTISEARQREMLRTLVEWSNDEQVRGKYTDICVIPDVLVLVLYFAVMGRHDDLRDALGDLTRHLPLLVTEPVLPLPTALPLIPDMRRGINSALHVVRESLKAQLAEAPATVPHISFLTLAALTAVLEWDLGSLEFVAAFLPSLDPLLAVLEDARVAHAVMLQVNNHYPLDRVVAMLDYLTARGFSLDPATAGRTHCAFAAYLNPNRFSVDDLIAVAKRFDIAERLLTPKQALANAKQLVLWLDEGRAVEFGLALRECWSWLATPVGWGALVWATAAADDAEGEEEVLVRLVDKFPKEQLGQLAESVIRCASEQRYYNCGEALELIITIIREADPALPLLPAFLPSLSALCDAHFAADLASLGLGSADARRAIAAALAGLDADPADGRYQYLVAYTLTLAPLLTSPVRAADTFHALGLLIPGFWEYTYVAFAATVTVVADPDSAVYLIRATHDEIYESGRVLSEAAIDAVLTAWTFFLTACPRDVLPAEFGAGDGLLDPLLEAADVELVSSPGHEERHCTAVAHRFLAAAAAHDPRAFASAIGRRSRRLARGVQFLPSSREFVERFDDEGVVRRAVAGTLRHDDPHHAQARHVLSRVAWTPGVMAVLRRAVTANPVAMTRVVAKVRGLAEAMQPAVAVDGVEEDAALESDFTSDEEDEDDDDDEDSDDEDDDE
ncbi:hypothetical protein H9P43_003785 [Blastocladiella emersonii ATCC 22665]|nr:hypothetical protein H9P43_003785 [Blastocladiella emersonii ATCC 22665]